MSYAIVESIAGVPVVLRPRDEAPGVAAGLFYPAGSRYEEKNEHGAAHFVEHLLFKGTKKRSCKEISREVEGRGGDLNAFTGEETLCLHGRVPAGHGAELVSLLAEMALESTFPEDEVERERGVITEEIRMMDDQPAVVAGEALNALLWPGQALGRSIAGTIASVGGYSPERAGGLLAAKNQGRASGLGDCGGHLGPRGEPNGQKGFGAFGPGEEQGSGEGQAGGLSGFSGGGRGQTGGASQSGHWHLCVWPEGSPATRHADVERDFGGGDELPVVPEVKGGAGVGLFGFERNPSPEG